MKRGLGHRTEVNMPDDPVAIRVKNLRKSFHLPTEQASGLKQALFTPLRGIKG